MRIGDYLFVNKMKYGPKLPQTPISIPFVHNRIPGTFIPSFTDWFSTEYSRLLWRHDSNTIYAVGRFNVKSVWPYEG